MRGLVPPVSPLLGRPQPLPSVWGGPRPVLPAVCRPAVSRPRFPGQSCPRIPTMSLLTGVWPPDLSRSFWPCHPLSNQSLSILCPPLSGPAEGHGHHSARGPMGNGQLPPVPYLCFTRASLDCGSGKWGSFRHHDRAGDGLFQGQEHCRPTGWRRASPGGLHRLAALFLGFWPKQPLGKERGVTVAGGTCFHGVWLTPEDDGAIGSWGPARLEPRVGELRCGWQGCPSIHPSIMPPAVRELAGVLASVTWGAVGRAAKSVSWQGPSQTRVLCAEPQL